MNKATERLKEIEEKLLTLNEATNNINQIINDSFGTANVDDDIRLIELKKNRLISERHGILLGLAEGRKQLAEEFEDIHND